MAALAESKPRTRASIDCGVDIYADFASPQYAGEQNLMEIFSSFGNITEVGTNKTKGN